ncbi:MAG TPA: divalent cation tolerance protein CutA [Syntrophales bacterium]|nr:divalent cation tolerance protein CutA [Syntrophales bacterium]
METATEWLCLIKTSRDAYDRVEKSIRELHPYEVPEIIAVPLTQGSRNYLAWLGEQILP